jgi:flagellar basal body P-ring formation protein FlgA
MIRTITSALILALVAAPAVAQSGYAPRLKAEATISGEIVRIGDLIENAGFAASTPIFRAPDLGQTGAVPAHSVLDAASRYGLIGIETRGVTEVSVTRASRVISTEEIEARIVNALAGRSNLGEAKNIKVTFDLELRAIHLEANGSADFQLQRMAYEPNSRRFDATFEITDANRTRTFQRYTGSAVETVEAAVTTRALARGDVVKVNDVVIERRPKAEFQNEAPATASEVVGMAARRAVRQGQPLRGADLMKAELVQKNDFVTLIFESPGITLTMRGKALESGAEGDTVSVQNMQSKRTIQGVVIGLGRVSVASFNSNQPRVVARGE